MSDDRVKHLAEHLRKNTGVKAFAGPSLELSSAVPFGIPTGVPQLDLALSRPGAPAGRVMEIFGPAASGKTALSYAIMAQAQRMGGLAMFIDTEKSLEETRARKCGVDTGNLLIAEPETIEGIFNCIIDTVNEIDPATPSAPFVITVDSITGVESKTNFEKTMDEEARVGEDARVIKKGVKKINPLLAEKNVLVIFINHVWQKIGALAFQKQTESAGGSAIRYYSSVRVELSAMGNLTEGKGPDQERLGMVSQLDVVKNKVAHTKKPKVKVELTQDGFDMYNGLWEAFQEIGALEKTNSMNYFFQPTQTALMKRDWKGFVDGGDGGLLGLYNFYIKCAIKQDYIKPYKGV